MLKKLMMVAAMLLLPLSASAATGIPGLGTGSGPTITEVDGMAVGTAWNGYEYQLWDHTQFAGMDEVDMTLLGKSFAFAVVQDQTVLGRTVWTGDTSYDKARDNDKFATGVFVFDEFGTNFAGIVITGYSKYIIFSDPSEDNKDGNSQVVVAELKPWWLDTSGTGGSLVAGPSSYGTAGVPSALASVSASSTTMAAMGASDDIRVTVVISNDGKWQLKIKQNGTYQYIPVYNFIVGDVARSNDILHANTDSSIIGSYNLVGMVEYSGYDSRANVPGTTSPRTLIQNYNDLRNTATTGPLGGAQHTQRSNHQADLVLMWVPPYENMTTGAKSCDFAVSYPVDTPDYTEGFAVTGSTLGCDAFELATPRVLTKLVGARGTGYTTIPEYANAWTGVSGNLHGDIHAGAPDYSLGESRMQAISSCDLTVTDCANTNVYSGGVLTYSMQNDTAAELGWAAVATYSDYL